MVNHNHKNFCALSFCLSDIWFWIHSAWSQLSSQCQIAHATHHTLNASSILAYLALIHAFDTAVFRPAFGLYCQFSIPPHTHHHTTPNWFHSVVNMSPVATPKAFCNSWLNASLAWMTRAIDISKPLPLILVDLLFRKEMVSSNIFTWSSASCINCLNDFLPDLSWFPFSDFRSLICCNNSCLCCSAMFLAWLMVSIHSLSECISVLVLRLMSLLEVSFCISKLSHSLCQSWCVTYSSALAAFSLPLIHPTDSPSNSIATFPPRARLEYCSLVLISCIVRSGLPLFAKIFSISPKSPSPLTISFFPLKKSRSGFSRLISISWFQLMRYWDVHKI